jgi:hypothetical protein
MAQCFSQDVLAYHAQALHRLCAVIALRLTPTAPQVAAHRHPAPVAIMTKVILVIITLAMIVLAQAVIMIAAASNCFVKEHAQILHAQIQVIQITAMEIAGLIVIREKSLIATHL